MSFTLFAFTTDLKNFMKRIKPEHMSKFLSNFQKLKGFAVCSPNSYHPFVECLSRVIHGKGRNFIQEGFDLVPSVENG